MKSERAKSTLPSYKREKKKKKKIKFLLAGCIIAGLILQAYNSQLHEREGSCVLVSKEAFFMNLLSD
jgi:hypothetical protein